MVGNAYVCKCSGKINEKEAQKIANEAKKEGNDAYKRILLKGNAELTSDGARALVKEGIYLIGVESQTVGPESVPMEVHKILLENEVVILEGIRLGEVTSGSYLLSCAPLNLKGLDGSPCRAILIKM